MPRAALLSLHARVGGVASQSWEDPALVQLWGPRFSAYVVAARDRWVFTLGRMPDAPEAQRHAVDLANRLEKFLRGRRMSYADAGRAIERHPNELRYAAPTGRVVIRWDGARQPDIWMLPAPEQDPEDARRELARRHFHVFGPATPDSFARWAGVRPAAARSAVESLSRSLVPVRTPVGQGWILAADEAAVRAEPMSAAAARLLPSGDTYTLLQGPQRELLVEDAASRAALWTPRVWPGAVLAGGEIVGTWRRSDEKVTISSWGRVTRPVRQAVEAEAATLPLPALKRAITVTWE